MMPPLQVVISHPPYEAAAQALAQRLQCPLQSHAEPGEGFVLDYSPEGLSLRLANAKGMLPLRVDFTQGSSHHRRSFGGGAGQMIAKAVGVQGRITPRVIDATAGLGGDGFVLACLGCQVQLFERSPVVHALLADGLQRAKTFAQTQDADLLTILNRIHLSAEDACSYFQQANTPPAPVIYLDPMFPERSKSAAVKKACSFSIKLWVMTQTPATYFRQP